MEEDEISTETSTQIGKKLTSSEKVALNNNSSKNEVCRYIRLTYLIPPLLDLIDKNKLRYIAGVELSHLKLEEQQAVYNFFFEEKRIKLDLKLTARIREFSKASDVAISVIEQLIKRIIRCVRKKSALQ